MRLAMNVIAISNQKGGTAMAIDLDQSLTAAFVQRVLGKTSGHVRLLSFKRGSYYPF